MPKNNRISKGKPEGGQFAPDLSGKANFPSSPSKDQPLSPVLSGSQKANLPPLGVYKESFSKL